MDFAFYAYSPPFSSLLFLFFCLLYIVYACTYGCINSTVGTCQAMVQRDSFFCHYLWNSWDRGLDVFSVATTKCTGLIKPWSNLDLLFCLTCQFFSTAADILQVTIAFVLKIFSFTDREKVLGDAFDRHCWTAACCSTRVKLVARGPNVVRHVFLCGPQSLKFKPQPT